MEARLADTLPEGEGWQYEPKWDGFRCLAFKRGSSSIDLRAKSGKPLTRYFPEVVEYLRELSVDRFVVDGELVIEIGGRLSFEALQMRLHPAESRIKKLAKETPAKIILFDLLVAPDGQALLDAPLEERRRSLETFAVSLPVNQRPSLSPATSDMETAQEWLLTSGAGDLDGVVCKRRDGAYVPGERAMIKVKRVRTADCVVGGFRYQSKSDLVGSLLLGLYTEDGKLDHVGFTSTITEEERPELTKRLGALGEPPGFTGKAPGGPSRWSTGRTSEWQPLKPELVVEVRYDQVTGHRFRHGTKLVRWRPDKRPSQCTFEQIR
ncbi:ATP-dependent DNA ligase [Rhizobium tarimense]|nr:ATP-dependent DNA ligase [Pseudorhizobium tarimense]